MLTKDDVALVVKEVISSLDLATKEDVHSLGGGFKHHNCLEKN